MYGPVFLYLFGASAEEDLVIDTWSVSKFERYAAAAPLSPHDNIQRIANRYRDR